MDVYAKALFYIDARVRKISMATEIRIETKEDSIYLEDQNIQALASGQEYLFALSAVKRIVVLTMDLTPFLDNMCLAVDMGNDTVIFIMSQHECFKPFLFDQIGEALPIDYDQVIAAADSTEDNVFEIYSRP